MYDEAGDLAWHKQEIVGIRRMLAHLGLPESGFSRCLDVGGGHGLHLPWLQEMADQILLADIVGYSSIYGGTYYKGLADRFVRHKVPFDITRIQCHTVDARDLIYRDDMFDLVVSINAFEHIPEPERAFREVIRVTKPGGLIILQFDPLWHSPEGHHLPALGLEPWQHVLEDEATFLETIRRLGGGEYEVDVYLNGMNREPYERFVEMFHGPLAFAFSRTNFARWAQNEAEETRSSHPNFQAARAAGHSVDNLVTRGIQFIAVKAESPAPSNAPGAPARTGLTRRIANRLGRALGLAAR